MSKDKHTISTISRWFQTHTFKSTQIHTTASDGMVSYNIMNYLFINLNTYVTQ